MRKPNRLINERSPYLLQHAYNPVDWYPWGDEAFQKAKTENKPIFLSIGYSSCHWCHVMERESFEDEKIADLINKYFVPVKVDREERPDVDEIYMKAVMMLTGHGGWPLTVFLTPDLKPFFGGTYFPPRRRGGLRGLDEILRGVAELWRKNPEEILKAAGQNVELLKAFYTTEKTEKVSSYNIIVQTFDLLATAYDSLYGGFGSAPKFPMPVYIDFLQMFSVMDKSTAALKMASSTLENMARGGIHDHLGGGFFRYSTDRIWLVPHFEKMLYDNALLARVYLQNYLLTRDPFFMDVGVSTLDWVLAELWGPEGGFYSAVDADSPEGEGAFYVWRMDEVFQVLEPDLAKFACKVYGITDAGNFEHGRNILTFKKDIETLAKELDMDVDSVKNKILQVKSQMLQHRRKRPAPAVDDKMVTSWNGLMISALARGFEATNEKRFLEAAIKSADFITSNLWKNGELYHIYKSGASVHGFLDDYAYVANGLLDVFQVTFEPRFLRHALEITQRMIELFRDYEDGGFFYSREEVAGLSRIKDAYDGATPSGNSVAALALIKMAELTGKTEYYDDVEGILKCFASRVETSPTEHAALVYSLAAFLSTRTEVVITCEDRVDAQPFLAELHKTFRPFTYVMVVDRRNIDELSQFSSLVSDKPIRENKVTAYVCQNYSCRMPVNTMDEFVKLLG